MVNPKEKEVNFDILISGCNTKCQHCYVNGGPAANMSLDDALTCIEKLDRLAGILPYQTSFTLDNEPINHPDVATIIRAAASVKHIMPFHHGMTTGIALMQREDKDSIVQTYLDCGWNDFGITLHGNPMHHDEITQRRGSFQTVIAMGEYLNQFGIDLNISVMINRFLKQDAKDLDNVFAKLQPSFVYFTAPNYTPRANMLKFEPYRATIGDLRAYSSDIPLLNSAIQQLLPIAEEGTIGFAVKLLEDGLNLKSQFMQDQSQLYLTVHQDCNLYLGNTGAETNLIGDLRILDIEKIAEIILTSNGNSDYTAFYNLDKLPREEKLMATLKTLPQDLLYKDFPSALYRGLDELRVPTRILSRLQ